MTIAIFVDSDACPVRDEVYKVAERHQVPVTIVANSYLRIPDDPLFTRVVVNDKFDAADDWIAERAGPTTVVVTSDILLAERCVKAASIVLAPTGKPFTENSIGMSVATRAIMADLRAGIGQTSGPAPFTNADRSSFLSALHNAIVRLKRTG
jgi:uncharacterized protein YaiI (UPF0178 family)